MEVREKKRTKDHLEVPANLAEEKRMMGGPEGDRGEQRQWAKERV